MKLSTLKHCTLLAIVATWLLNCHGKEPPIVKSGWVRLDVDGIFTISAPPDFFYEPGHSIDSKVGTIKGHGIKIFFDYGFFSYSGPQRTADSYKVEKLTVSGVKTQLITWSTVYEGKKYLAAGIFRLKPPRSHGKLTITTHVSSPEKLLLVKEILRTLEFPE